MKLKAVSKLCFATALSIGCSFAVTPTIGVASAFGTFTVNNAEVEGNANVFEGSQIKTGVASSRVYLENGAALTLGADSAGTFYKNRLVLQQGATRVDGMNHYTIEAARYRIQSAEPASEAVVRLSGGEIQIAALSGSVNVFNQKGALLTRIAAGSASSFDTDDNKPSPNAQSGATAQGQSGATATTGAEAARKRKHQEELLYLTLGVTLAGLGLGTDAILQPGSGPPPTSP